MIRQSRERQNYLNKTGVERGNMGKNIVHKLKKGMLAAAFCLVLNMSMLCMADEEGIVLGDSCNIRATTDTNGTVIGNAKKNQKISIISEVAGNDGKTWYQVWVDASTKGYIRADLVQKSAASETTAATTATALPETSVTAVEAKSATVNTNNVNIRKGAGTAYGAVATANKGMTLTVTGEASASNGQKWYQVKFSYNSKEITGFIRSDLVTFGAVDTTEVSEITGAEVSETPETEEETAPTEAVPETEEQPETTVEENTESSSSSAMILMNVTEEPYIMPGFEKIILNWENQDINAYKNGDFYLFYAQKQSGEEGWYVFDSSMGTYQRYAYAVDGVTPGEDTSLLTGIIPVIILVVIIVILLAVVGLLFIRLREYTSEEYDDEEDEEDEDEEDEDDEDDEEMSEEEEPVKQRTYQQRRPQKAPSYEEPVMRREPVEERRPEQERPVRRPSAEMQRPVRRPANGQRPEENAQRPVRRPANGARPEGAAPVRREQDRPVRSQSGEVTRRRPSGEPVQGRPARQTQQGYRAQNFLEKEDQDDMEFIDL